jgi:hypothetical protein
VLSDPPAGDLNTQPKDYDHGDEEEGKEGQEEEVILLCDVRRECGDIARSSRNAS